MVEGETPNLVLEMSWISVNLLFLATEVCFPGNERAHNWIFSENEEKQRRTVCLRGGNDSTQLSEFQATIVDLCQTSLLHSDHVKTWAGIGF